MFENNGRELIERLMHCGLTESSATDICHKYAAVHDWTGLESFIRCTELLYDDRREYV